MKNILKKLTISAMIFMLSINVAAVYAEETGTPVTLPSDVEDGVMSNPDGYEPILLRGSGYNLTWTTENGKKVMYDGNGNKFGSGESKKVIDVSSYNGNVNWTAAKNGGVDGGILRATSYAGGSIHQDDQFANNVKGVKNAKMPFGVYLYSYATNSSEALYEANYLINILKNNGVSSGDLTYPVYLDLEGNNYTNGISVSTYEQIVATFINKMNAAGYKTHVYSYKSYLTNNLNSPNIHKYVSWVAQYGKALTFENNYYKGTYGWQYQSNGSVPGVSGEVDVSCFTDYYGINSAKTQVKYRSHVQNLGWQGWSTNGSTSGTSGLSLRLESLAVALETQEYAGSIQYKTHVQNLGWQDWKSDGQVSGTVGNGLRLEAMQIKLTGEMANHYDVYYRVHAQYVGWMGWAKNGESAGTAGYGRRLEAYQIMLVPKGSKAPGATSGAYAQTLINYETHVQDVGWQGWKYDGEVSGTVGMSRRLEGVIVNLANQLYGGSLRYKTHVQNLGWQGWVSQGQIAGTYGKSLRLEAIQMELTGDMAKHYDVYYRVHVQNLGWMGWAKNGQSSGTAGYKYRLEGLQVVLVTKGGKAPGSTSNIFRQK